MDLQIIKTNLSFQPYIDNGIITLYRQRYYLYIWNIEALYYYDAIEEDTG